MNNLNISILKMKSNNINENNNDVKVEINTNQNNEGTENRLLKNDDLKPYDKFKNRMKVLFKEFENDDSKLEKVATTSAINFAERELDLQSGFKIILIFLIISIACAALILYIFLIKKYSK